MTVPAITDCAEAIAVALVALALLCAALGVAVVAGAFEARLPPLEAAKRNKESTNV